MKKNNYITYGIYLLVFAIYSLIVIMAFKNYNGIFWTAYGFAAVTLLVHVFELSMHLKHTEEAKKFIGIPMVVATGIFSLIALGTSFAFMLLKNVSGIRPVIIVMGVILILQVIIVLISIYVKDSHNAAAENRKIDVVFIRGVGVDLDMMINKCSDVKLKKDLLALKEVVEYSDPISKEVVSSYEDSILESVESLRSAIEEGDNIQAKELCLKTKDLFIERNKILLSVK